MHTRRTVTAFCTLCLLLVSGTERAFSQDATIAFEGSVSDSKGMAVPGVRIRIYRNGRRVGDDRTDADGKYRIPVPPGPPVAVIRYDHSSHYPGVIALLSGSTGQHIHKVLQDRTSVQRSFSALTQQFEDFAELASLSELTLDAEEDQEADMNLPIQWMAFQDTVKEFVPELEVALKEPDDLWNAFKKWLPYEEFTIEREKAGIKTSPIDKPLIITRIEQNISFSNSVFQKQL